MFDHECAGIQVQDNLVMACKCLSRDMYEKVIRYARSEFIEEVRQFADENHHHSHEEERDVVIVTELLDFLERRDNDGLGTP